MARKDPTYSAGDIIRFYCENLTEAEKRDVQFFFWIYVPLVAGLPSLLDLISKTIKDPRIRLVIQLISRLWAAILDLSPTALSVAVPKSIRKEVNNCFL